MKYAVIKVSGKQYRVSEGEKVLVDKIKGNQPLKVLLVKENEKVFVGKPYLDKVRVSFEREDDVKGRKIDIVKYKAKSRYRKHIGFRAQHTPIIIKSISL